VVIGTTLLLAAAAVAIILTVFRDPAPGTTLPVPEAEWAVYRPAGGGCSVLMPGNPRVMRTPTGDRYWLIRKQERCEFLLVCGHPGENVGVDDIPKLLAIDRASLLRTFENSKVGRDEDTTFAGFPGREMEIDGTGGRVSVMRGFLTGTGRAKRVYELRVGGFGIRADDGDAAKFFNSFRLEEGKAAAAAPVAQKKG
jgi:hypothetical protein